MTVSNKDVVLQADLDISSSSGSMHASIGQLRHISGSFSWMPHKVREAINEHARNQGQAMDVIYSYDTPIAVRIGYGPWIVPDVSYSVTTGKHQYLVRHHMDNYVDVPYDATIGDIEGILDGYLEYSRASSTMGRGPRTRRD